MTEDVLTERVIGAAIDIHKTLGPGLLESTYRECMYYKLSKMGIWVEKEKEMPLIYEEIKLECGYRIDLLVANTLVVELKSIEKIHDVHIAQTLTYMKLSGCKLGLLINFNVPLLKDGIKRLKK
jgi:GxxExxY protein